MSYESSSKNVPMIAMSDFLRGQLTQLHMELQKTNRTYSAWREKFIGFRKSSSEKDISVINDILQNSMASISSLEHQSQLLTDRVKSQLAVYTPEWKRMGYKGGK
ncbi:MAG: hypothetical protein WC554_04060 [Clostridia bacterium]|jgi:hypothetical protein